MKNTALLIYASEDIEKNKWFIGRLTDIFAERGGELLLMTPEECRREKLWDDCPPVFFVVNRSRDAILSEEFEKNGIRSFNNSKTVRIGNDKLAEYELFKKLELPVMETVGGNTPPAKIPFEFPVIVKSRNGHGGSEVFKADSPEDLERIMEGKDPEGFIFQKMCDEPGKDMRVYVLGGKIIASVLRSSDSDFRSNFSLGGNVELTEPDDEVKEYVRILAEELDPDYIGIDLIRDGGRWVLNEMEDAAGARMLYKLTDLDIADMYMCHICEKSSQNVKNGIK